METDIDITSKELLWHGQFLCMCSIQNMHVSPNICKGVIVTSNSILECLNFPVCYSLELLKLPILLNLCC